MNEKEEKTTKCKICGEKKFIDDMRYPLVCSECYRETSVHDHKQLLEIEGYNNEWFVIQRLKAIKKEYNSKRGRYSYSYINEKLSKLLGDFAEIEFLKSKRARYTNHFGSEIFSKYNLRYRCAEQVVKGNFKEARDILDEIIKKDEVEK